MQSAAQLGVALPFFPAVGLLLGALVATGDGALRALLAPAVVSALVVVALVVLTGALHLDGLVDTCDALCLHASPAERLALMHDSRARDPGAIAACLLLLGKFAAILLLPEAVRTSALLVAPLVGRWANVAAYWGYPYARRTPGASLALKQGATGARMLAATAFTLGSLLLVLGPAGGLVLLGAAALTHGVACLSRQRLGGLTGDVYGAITELVETAALVLVPLAVSAYRV